VGVTIVVALFRLTDTALQQANMSVRTVRPAGQRRRRKKPTRPMMTEAELKLVFNEHAHLARLVRSKRATTHECIDLAVLCWLLTDPGYATPQPMLNECGERYPKLIAQVRTKARGRLKYEAMFWERYFRWASFGYEFDPDEAEALYRKGAGSALVYLAMCRGGALLIAQSDRLLRTSAEYDAKPRGRYLWTVLQSLKRF
jgi:hypothetical protein